MELVHVKGLAQLGYALREIPKIVAARKVREATAAPARLVRDRARVIAPVYHGEVQEGHPPPGTLRKAIQIKRITGLPSVRCVYIVFVRHGARFQHWGKKQRNLDAYYWWWVEFGTSKFRPAEPFLRPAFEAEKGEALVLLIERLRIGILESARTVAWGRTR